MKKQLVIVGNAPLPRPLAEEINAADYVVRFNEPQTPTEQIGTRTDLLILATTNKPMQLRLQETGFLKNPIFLAAKEIMLAYHPSIISAYHPKPNILSRLKGRRADWTVETINVLGRAGKEIRVMPPQFYLDGCRELGLSEQDMGKTIPSTGFLGIRYLLEKYPAESWDIQFCGFTWQGWKRHAWTSEKDWVQSQVAAGRMSELN
ncbi:hypothetical protein ACLBWS_12750 [Brucellaceae bacterium D45D]